MQSVICGLQSVVCSLQSANVRHRCSSDLAHNLTRSIAISTRSDAEVLMEQHLGELAIGNSLNTKGLLSLNPKIVRRFS